MVDIQIRQAGPDDCDFLLAIRNDDDVRGVSRETAPISPASHRQWYLTRVKQFPRNTWIIQLPDQPLGYVRFDRFSEIACEISMAIARSYRGQRLGSKALKMALDLAPTASIAAFIAIDNQASIRCFENAGFRFEATCRPDGRAWNKYIFSHPPTSMRPL